jgi:hypothetical protein
MYVTELPCRPKQISWPYDPLKIVSPISRLEPAIKVPRNKPLGPVELKTTLFKLRLSASLNLVIVKAAEGYAPI